VQGIIVMGAIALMVFMVRFVLGSGRRVGRVRVRYGPSRSAQAGAAGARGLGRMLAFGARNWSITLPVLAALALVGSFFYLA
jgi:hypothetical protein